MIRPVTYLVDRPRRVRSPFVLAELVLVLAVPILAFLGLSTLLGSRAGTFVEAPGPTDPGYRALVESTPVSAIVELVDSRLTGVAVITRPAGETGGAVLLVPGELEVEGVKLASLVVDDAIALLERELALQIGDVEVVEEERWLEILGDASFEIDNPDPIGVAEAVPSSAQEPSVALLADEAELDEEAPADAESGNGPAGDGSAEDAARDVLFGVGPITVDGSNIGVLLGTPGIGGDPQSLLFRRELVWRALLASTMQGDDPVASLLNGVAAGDRRVAALPTRNVGDNLVIDADEAEAQIRQFVPFPSGASPGDRLRVRVLDQVGGADVLGVASRLASLGYEVVEIGNVAIFADSSGAEPTLIVPLGMEDDRIVGLAAEMDADTMVSNEIDSELDGMVTLLVSG